MSMKDAMEEAYRLLNEYEKHPERGTSYEAIFEQPAFRGLTPEELAEGVANIAGYGILDAKTIE